MTEPTDAEIRGLAHEGNGVYQDDETAVWEITDPSLIKFARAVLAKWGTPPAVAGEPVAEVISTNGLEAEFTCEMLHGHVPALGAVVYLAAPQPTQAQAGTPCRKNPFYHGPRNCSRGTVGCCEDHGVNTHPQAGAVPLTRERLQEISLDYSDSEDECTGFRDGWRAAEKHHGIKGGQHGAE